MKLQSIFAVFMVTAIFHTTVLPLVYAGPGATAHQPLQLATAQTHRGEGTVMKISDGKVQLSHGPIESLGWGPMKMFFDVADAELLEGIEVNDQVEFELAKTPDGRWVITDIATTE